MKDRQPTPGKEGMVKLTLTDGKVLEGRMEMADYPFEPGDPLNKATLLKDATAALFDLGSDAVPDDVLAWVGKYNLHWWRRKTYSSGWKVNLSAQTTERVWVSYNDTTAEFQYSSEVDISEGGVVSLKNPSSGYIDANTYANLNVVKGKYWKANTSNLKDKGILYTSPDALDAKRGSYSDYNDIQMQYGTVTGEYVESVGEWEYLQSPSRSAYPDSGEQGGYEYQYLGIPFNNASTAPKIATGSYVGTGKCGESSPNSLTFASPPKLLFITNRLFDRSFYGTSDIDGNPLDCTLLKEAYSEGLGFADVHKSDILSGYAKKSLDGKTVYWYHEREANSQQNTENYIYYYFAFLQ